MNRAERIARATEIYQEEKARYDERVHAYRVERQKWLEENKAAMAIPNASVNWSSQPKPPRSSDPEATIRIMDELTVSRDMANEYIAIIKHRSEQ